jgi:hypothetical protein
MFWAIAAIGLVFVLTAVNIEPEVHCTEYPCPDWLLITAVVVGGGFATSAIVSMYADYQYGSRVDVERGRVLWWAGYPPYVEHAIPLAVIARILVEPASDTASIQLFDSNGRRLPLPVECVPHPVESWALAVAGLDPHIQVERVG